MNKLLVGRHGRVDDDGNLSVEGHSDALQMAETLRGLGVGRHALLLSSVAPRAVQTAGLVRAELGIPTVVRSPFITKAGNHPEPVRDLREFAGNILVACGINHEDTDVVMVTHLPLVKAVANGTQQHGGIYDVPSGWENPAYSPDFELLLERSDRW